MMRNPAVQLQEWIQLWKGDWNCEKRLCLGDSRRTEYE